MQGLARWTRSFALLAVVPVAACATINTGVDRVAVDAGVRNGVRVHLRGNPQGVTILNEENERLQVRTVEDPTFGQAVGNAMARSAAENRGGGTYTEVMRMTPAIFLSPKRDHTLRLVRADGSSVVVQRNRRIGKKYLIIDWLIFAPTVGFSIAIDWTTGQWNTFEDIDVDLEFRKAAASTGAGE